MYFLNEEHLAGYRKLLDTIPNMRLDRGYLAAGYILALPELRQNAGCFSDCGLDIRGINEAYLPESARYLLHLAANLYNSENSFNLGKALNVLDAARVKVLIEAIKLKTGRD